MAGRRARVEFTEEEKKELIKAFDDGMNSVARQKLPQIQEIAHKFKKDEKEIKNWIGNERSRRKRILPSAVTPLSKKPPQKLRAPNSYNLFVKEFFKSPEGRKIADLADKNKAASVKWKALCEEEKDKYHQLATQVPTVSSTPGPSTHFNKWHETQRILSNFQGNCEWAEKFGIHVMYIVCNEKNHYVGGTKSGRQFLESNPHLPASYLISTKPGVTPIPPDPSSRKELRSQVQEQLNAKYSLAVGDSQARVPYKHLRPEHVIGLPPGMSLNHPSMLSQDKLEAIYSNLSSIKFVGVPPKLPQSDSDHSYAKIPPNTSTMASTLEQSNSCAHTQGYTTLSTKGIDCNVMLDSQNETPKCSIGQSVQLLSLSYSPIGTAVTMTGDKVHGHDIPDGYVKIAIKKIDAGVKSLVKGDDEDLSKDSITAWPLKFTRRI